MVTVRLESWSFMKKPKKTDLQFSGTLYDYRQEKLKGDRKAMVILGHALIVVGAYLITWGLYLLPVSNPSLMGILGKPLFWGIFCLFGGICSIFHGFCACVRNFKVDKSDS